MIGSARVGERRLNALIAELGSGTTRGAVEVVLDGAERQARAVIAEWLDGEYEGVAHLDDDGHGFHDIHIHTRVTVRGSDLRVALSDSHPQVLGFVNSPCPDMRSAVAMALAYLIDPDTPKNDGTFRPLEVIAKEGAVVWAREGAPVTLATKHPHHDHAAACRHIQHPRDTASAAQAHLPQPSGQMPYMRRAHAFQADRLRIPAYF